MKKVKEFLVGMSPLWSVCLFVSNMTFLAIGFGVDNRHLSLIAKIAYKYVSNL